MLWLTQVEVQFLQREIVAQTTKFDHVLANLTQEIAMKVRDLIMNLPEDNLYDVVVEYLVFQPSWDN